MSNEDNKIEALIGQSRLTAGLEREFMVKEKWLIAIFVMGLIVMLLSLATAVVNWKTYLARVELVSWMEQLQQRVIVLEEKELDRQQYMLQQQQLQKPKKEE